MQDLDLVAINKELHDKEPEAIVEWAAGIAKKPVITTNFRPYESAILHLVTRVLPDIDVIWCDTGYNTSNTYRHAKDLIHRLHLNIHIYVPKWTVGFRDVMMGIPEIGTPEHEEFTEQVKLEPFRRAMDDFKPDVWFTNLRYGQTELRSHLDIVSQSHLDAIKVCPFYLTSDEQLFDYVVDNMLPNEMKYYDPTKGQANRECGLHNKF